MDLQEFDWRDRNVFVTGHTGFKGSWLTAWLNNLGAAVYGYSLDPENAPSMFEAANISSLTFRDNRSDILDLPALTTALIEAQPEVVFHLAAQPLVRRSFAEPVETITTNVLGTTNLLEACRAVPTIKAIVVITTDKVYRNNEWVFPYREVDQLGGKDLYSASKACCELLVDAYRNSFYDMSEVQLATARAGNVIGGGDWSQDRLIPDIFRAAQNRRSLNLRYPLAIRPWQHVLEPIYGYIKLAQYMVQNPGESMPTSWNFGPDPESSSTVQWIAESVISNMEVKTVVRIGSEVAQPEAQRLELDSSQARSYLSWSPTWNIIESIRRTIDWHEAWLAGTDMCEYTNLQIRDYQNMVSTR